MALIVTAPYVTVETDVGPGRARIDIPRGEPVPADVSAEDRDRLLRLGHVAELDEPAEATVPAGPDPDAVPDGTIAVVLDWVGDDPEKAQRALDVEEAKGDRARSTLVADLSAIAEQ